MPGAGNVTLLRMACCGRRRKTGQIRDSSPLPIGSIRYTVVMNSIWC